MNDLGDENVGATKRHNLTANGKKMDMIGYIHDDVFRQMRLLFEMQGQPCDLPGVSKRPQKEQHVFSNKTSEL